ncbi:PIG-L family deacetylase [Rapidithrix thailandica]|uniref:PIG-L family deacetylase n=1 Tax=Rapidithrix thailandica TaxID=413964 RepID=UPI0032168EA4
MGSVLYIAAHPDDENTRLIAYLANEKGFETRYLSLTRGDGGQNLIGKEVREELGIIRTQELLAARRKDGGQQAFSRANDFGYSKHPNETLNIWDKQKVLADIVWAIRQYRPDVIITRFSPNSAGKTHGHHTTSAILALEAFHAAGNKLNFPEQLEYVEPWQPKRIFWNASWWSFQRDASLKKDNFLKLDVGQFNPLLGKSYGEMAAISRTMHKSQGFGSGMARGQEMEYFQHLAGTSVMKDLFEGIDFSWERIPEGKAVGDKLQTAFEQFDVEQPHRILPLLAKAYQLLEKYPKAQNFWVKTKKQELEDVMLACAGIWCEANAPVYSISPGDSLKLEAELVKQLGDTPVKLLKVQLGKKEIRIDSTLTTNREYKFPLAIKTSGHTAITQPYWLQEASSNGMFKVADPRMVGLPENPVPFPVTFTFQIQGATFQKTAPVNYKWVDPVDGERLRPLEIRPSVTVNLPQPVYLFSAEKSKKIKLLVKAHTAQVQGNLSLSVPPGWKAQPATIAFDLKEKFEEKTVEVELFPPATQSEGTLSISIHTGKEHYSYSLKSIEYAHIPVQTLFPPAEAKLVRINLQSRGKRIGYIPGAGDAIPEALREIGYQVDALTNGDITLENLKKYGTVITGVRAYNTNSRMKFIQETLMNYVHQGGNLIVQYNTSHRLVTDELGPYPLKLSRDRVTVEESPVKILTPEHEILNSPNKITAKDFEGWVQERGLYFPNKWDEHYIPILSSHDPGESPKPGGLLVTHYGKGSYIYTGYSWFRQLPAGVPGAFRLFVNLISYRNPQAN